MRKKEANSHKTDLDDICTDDTCKRYDETTYCLAIGDSVGSQIRSRY